ncbi:MAG: hypothetical protein WBQ20_10460, partial [Methyloceanibacter sp.]
AVITRNTRIALNCILLMLHMVLSINASVNRSIRHARIDLAQYRPWRSLLGILTIITVLRALRFSPLIHIELAGRSEQL